MEQGWDATGLLSALWDAVGKRDGLAAITGIRPSTLSAYNSGSRKLGLANGHRIAAALGVTIYEIGAPREVVSGDPVLQALAEIKALLIGAQNATAARISHLFEMQARAMEEQAGLLRELSAVVADLRAANEDPGQPKRRRR